MISEMLLLKVIIVIQIIIFMISCILYKVIISIEGKDYIDINAIPKMIICGNLIAIAIVGIASLMNFIQSAVGCD